MPLSLHKGPAMTLFLENARIIDPEGDTILSGNVIVDAGQIAAIGAASAPKGAQVIDCGCV